MVLEEPTSPKAIEEAMASASPKARQAAAKAAATVLPTARLVELVRAGTYATRAAAMEALALAGHKALGAVLEGFRTSEPSTALFFVQVLGNLDADEARAVLREVATGPDLLMGQAAVEALGVQRDVGAVPLLLSMLEGERDDLEADPWRVISAIIALGQIGDPAAKAGLLRLRGSDMFRSTTDEALASIHRATGE